MASLPHPLDPESALDREFLEMRCRTLDLAAALDRLDRSVREEAASGVTAASIADDPRIERLKRAIAVLAGDDPDRAATIQKIFSREYDPDWMTKRSG